MIILLRQFNFLIIGFVTLFGYCILVFEKYCTSTVTYILPSPRNKFQKLSYVFPWVWQRNGFEKTTIKLIKWRCRFWTSENLLKTVDLSKISTCEDWRTAAAVKQVTNWKYIYAWVGIHAHQHWDIGIGVPVYHRQTGVNKIVTAVKFMLAVCSMYNKKYDSILEPYVAENSSANLM